MSLKAFHIVFIAASTLLSFGFGAWLLEQHRENGSSSYLVGGVLAMVAGLGLIVYGRYFLKKLKKVSFL